MTNDYAPTTGPRLSPRGGWGNAEPTAARPQPNGFGFTRTPGEWVLWNARIAKSRADYEADRLNDAAPTVRPSDAPCKGYCGALTRAVNGYCRKCQVAG